jgi:O-antigen/teichoic acid export membrane protein
VYSLLAYAPFVLAYLLIPASLLAILGSGFQEASDILRIMVIGQSVNAATGLAATSLQMTRDEGSLLRLNLVFLVVGALAIAGLGWRYGLQGAAWGQSLALAGRNLAVYLRARASLRRPATTDGAV